MGITYQRPKEYKDGDDLFYGYTATVFANMEDMKSIIGYVYLVAGGAVTWRSKKQVIIVLLSTEAEYITLLEAAREACWLRNIYDELGFTQLFLMILKGDNDGSISMAENPQFHQRSKHIVICYHWIWELVKDNHIVIESCHNPEQTADVLMKVLPRAKFTWHREEIGVRAKFTQ